LNATQISDHYSKATTTPPPVQPTLNYSYDADGHETAAGTTSYNWNLASRLTSATVNGTTTSYSYDGDGNRLTSTTAGATTNYQWDTNAPLPELASERDSNGNLIRRYVYGSAITPLSLTTPANTYYYHYDQLGSVTNLTNSTGATQWTYSYEP